VALRGRTEPSLRSKLLQALLLLDHALGNWQERIALPHNSDSLNLASRDCPEVPFAEIIVAAGIGDRQLTRTPFGDLQRAQVTLATYS